jgi:hypothetical protein
MISNFKLQEGNDMFNWNLSRDGTFSLHSMHLHRLDSIALTITRGFGNYRFL